MSDTTLEAQPGSERNDSPAAPTRTQRTIKNALFSQMGVVLPILVGIFTQPYIVGKLGTEVYGIYIVTLNVTGYFAFLDFGIASAAIKYIAEYVSIGKRKEASAVFTNTLFTYLVIGVIGALLILSVTPFTASRIKVHPNLVALTFFACYMASIGFIINLLMAVYSSISQALQRYDLYSKINVIYGVFNSVVSVCLLAMGYGLREILIVNSLLACVVIVMHAISAKQLLPELVLTPEYDKEVASKLFHFGKFAILSRIGSTMAFNLDSPIIGMLVSTSAVTYYYLPVNMVKRLMLDFTYQLATVMFPVSSELAALGEWIKLRAAYIRSVRLLTLIQTAAAVPLFIFAYPLLHFYMDRRVPGFADKSALVMAVTVIAYYVMGFSIIPSWIVVGVGNPKLTGYMNLMSACFHIGLLIPLVMRWGVKGAGCALLGNILPTLIFLHLAHRNILKIANLEVLLKGYVPGWLAGLIGVGLAKLMYPLPHSLKATLFLILLNAAFIICAGMVTGAVSKEDRAELWSVLSKALPGARRAAA